MAGNALTLTDETFDQEVINSGKPALVDFWAEWCMPCKMIAPLIEELATEYAGRVVVGKVNTDDCHGTAVKFGISAIPSLLLFKDGQLVKKLVGLQQKGPLKAALDDLLQG